MKLLLIQLSGAGDLLQSTLLFRCLKKSVPGAEVHLLVQQQHAEMVATNPNIDSLHRLHFNEQTTLHELLPQHFDHVLDLQPCRESALFAQQLPPSGPVVKQKGLKAFFELFRGRAAVPTHKAEAYLQKAAALNVQHDGGGLDFFIPDGSLVPFADIPASHHAGFIAIALPATPAFEWPLHLLQQLCTRMPHPLILLGSQNDSALAQRIMAIDNIKIYNACGKFSLHETADLVRKAKLLVAFQPYFIQMAAAFNKEMVMLDAGKSDAPYYSPWFIKSQPSAPFDKIAVPKEYNTKADGSIGNKMQNWMEKTATQITAKTIWRLQGTR